MKLVNGVAYRNISYVIEDQTNLINYLQGSFTQYFSPWI